MTQYLSDQDYGAYQPGPAGEMAVCTDPASTGNNCLTTPDCVDGKIANALASIELGGVLNVHLVTAATTITVGSGTGRLFVIVVGGGGGGRGGSTTASGAGGGGGGVSIGLVTVTAEEAVVCTVGNGGSAGAAQGAGGDAGYSLIKGITAYGGKGATAVDEGGEGGKGEEGNPAVFPASGLLWSKRGSFGFVGYSGTAPGAGGPAWGANLDKTKVGSILGGSHEDPFMFAFPESDHGLASSLWAVAYRSIGHRGCGGGGGTPDAVGFAGGAGIILVIELGS